MHESWREFLEGEFEQDYFKELAKFLKQAYAERVILPPKQKVFRAFSTDLEQVKVVIFGQDPYHQLGVANGLAFSVRKGQKLPASLMNIYKEIDNDLGQHHNIDGDLSAWQKQGVMLLNDVLTVEAHQAGSHRDKGWEVFTDACIRYLNEKRPHLVFILWGSKAREKKKMIDTAKHLIIESAHPSPLSAYRGFFGSKPFSRANRFLREKGETEIKW